MHNSGTGNHHPNHEHMNHDHESHHASHGGVNLNKMAASATLHCLTGCALGEVTGLIIPGAMSAGLVSPLFWISMPIALTVAYLAAFPVNKYLLSKGKGHALVMKYHEGHAR